jgi:uncharacterized protein (DUF2249 family)
MEQAHQEILLDVRGLEPPEPLELALDALSILKTNQCLRMIINREPYPLYPMLDRDDFLHETDSLPDGGCEIRIWRKP